MSFGRRAARGEIRQQTADRPGLSVKAVETHRPQGRGARPCAPCLTAVRPPASWPCALGLANCAALMRFALARGWLEG